MIPYLDAIKNSRAYKIIEQDAQQDKIAHSYMIISEDKLTLQSFLQVFLQTIYCPTHNACSKCEKCTKTENFNNPNAYWILNDDSIKVDQIKDLIMDTYLAPVENDFKTYVIKNAELMNEASQNKLLKTIEEPNKNVIIILGVSSEQAMLQTIKSRTKKIYLNVWNDDLIKKELSKMDSNEQNVLLASKFCKGNLTKGIALLTDKNFQEQYANIVDLLKNYTNTSLIANYINTLGKDKDEINFSMNILEGIVQDTMHDLNNNEKSELATMFNLNTLANINDLIIETNKRLNSNCNPQAVSSFFLLKLAEIKYLLA